MCVCVFRSARYDLFIVYCLHNHGCHDRRWKMDCRTRQLDRQPIVASYRIV